MVNKFFTLTKPVCLTVKAYSLSTFDKKNQKLTIVLKVLFPCIINRDDAGIGKK